jgi:type I restriction enzyme M protein
LLDNETKRRIDTARDILVGKVPDPKSQVEQITIALIYKFMDDMDKESVEMGGKTSFFTSEYEKYAWSKMFDPRLGGFDMLALYSEAITRMVQNPNIPQLFRDIFKNAYLPYRDPETLKLFLKTINEFTYDHSERLGDAFEYLLSVLGSQGEAGQFRTPRHIIDFMVDVVKPQKNETVIDPACGTAGFLISSYKHILKDNTKKIPGDLLTPDERKKLLANFKGYDISPDMVRLSLVNLYLHGFVQPQIIEYDTLTSEDRWHEYADVIMANPPFMSPKGGIKPHKKFGVQSNRSEVLFVDYIAEHLTPKGRAAVIVPEGIIFQSAGAYKQLRKMLVKNYLYAVVSLPAGVFNPYSGVKTSILFMDRQLTKKTDSILFVKIENDGYGLGAQRREIDKNDLPDAGNVITDYVKAVRSGAPDSFKAQDKPCGALLVSKGKLAENDEYNLTGDRYRTTERRVHQKWPMVALEEVIATLTPPKKLQTTDFKKMGKYPIIDQSQELIAGWSDDEEAVITQGFPYIVFGDHTCSVKYLEKPFIQGADGIKILSTDEKLFPKYLFFVLKTKPIESDGYKRHFSKLKETKIPLPPLEVQREIVGEIEGYQKLIDGARQVVESWKPQIEIDPAWPMVRLGEVCENLDSQRRPVEKSERKPGPYPYYGASGIVDYVEECLFDGDYLLVSEDGANLLARTTPIAFSISGKSWVNNHAHILKFESTDKQKFIEIYLNQINLELYITGMAQPKLNQAAMNGIPIPLPSIEVQREIVAKIEAERKVVDGCKELIALYEAKIKKVIDKVWEE